MSPLLAALSCPTNAQTYKVGDDASARVQSKSSQTSSPDQSLGWGTNIQNARLAQSATAALKRGDHALAVDYAQRAAQAAPGDAQLWFLLGYAARLDGKTQLSIDAYNRGLQLNPSALDGLSGLAQTYSTIGRNDEAQHLLMQVVSADPRRRDDALLLGDLSMRSGDYTAALEWLSKAERIEPDARSELLMALCYQHLKQMDMASRYLEAAKRRAPDNQDVQRSLAGYYREIGNYPQAIASLKSIRNPKPDVAAELAYTYQLDGKLDDSAQLYAQAANAMPKDLGLQLSAAQAAIAAGSIDHANSFLQRATGIDADYYRLHAIRGEIAQIQERDREAAGEYSSALAHLPLNPAEGPLYGIQLHMDLMEMDQKINDAAAAKHQLEIAQTQVSAMDDHGPSRGQFLRLRALIKMNAGQLESALSDMREALALNAQDPNNLQLDGDLLMKLGRTEDAIAVYKRIIAIDPANRFALTSLGYASRASGQDQEAEKYFQRLAQAYPLLYVPYLALGDLYTSDNQFTKAEATYSKGYEMAPHNALIIAGGMNAAIEAHDLNLAGVWLSRSTSDMQHEPQILREKERYLRFKGEYQQSAEVGLEAIKVLPNDRDVVVYLGYDLLNLEKYDELLELTNKYNLILPKEPDVPLLAGYVHKHEGQPEKAREDFTEAVSRDPNVVTAYVNRGYMLNDLHQPQSAAEDFEAALKREPKNGEAHLGLAYASLDLHKPQVALRQAQMAEAELGDSEHIHLIRATAYGREGMLAKSAYEYRAALKFTPDDGALHFALGGTLYSERQYHDAVEELLIAQKLSQDNAFIYALLARSYAQLQDRDQTLKYVELAQQHAKSMPSAAGDEKSVQSEIFVSTGQALNMLGDRTAAMDCFRKALVAPDSDRVSVRLAIAQLMVQQDDPDDAARQIALAQMEAQAGETMPPTGEQLVEAADVFRGLHDYQLSQTYLERAQAAGASQTTVRIGMADNYLALGDTARAQGELSAISNAPDSEPNYQYLLAEANVLQQEHQNTQALTAFGQATNAAGDDQTAEQSLIAAGANEGWRVAPELSLLSDFSIQPVFEDSTVYVLDAKLDAPFPVSSSDTALLPPPRSSIETQGTVAYHLHFGYLPAPGGFFQVRNAQGEISVPSTNSVVNRDTTDYTFNFGLNPTVHFGTNVLTFNAGLQTTVRRDSESPVQMNQNLFRVFTYVSTSSFFNVLSASGYIIRESGPFTESNLHSQSLTGAIDFRVGAPWGKTALVTGWGRNDQQFAPTNYENYYTSSYIGLERRFTDRLRIRAVAEDLRAWRVVGTASGIAQNLRPSGTVDFAPTRNWDLQASTSYSSTRSFHVYDAVQNGFSISYARSLHRKFNDESGEVTLQYPIRFSAGFQEETFFNFPGGNNQQFRPYVSITVF
ncbi:tetratricopeptide repeat protein [Alloacidobacterium dinghuense]|uniref:tetratricopeptide repeat protein n=1 Tax=Alloacidobacterium dinghuense TaxID=2763107 RepID=UPI0020372839|nr:tetratricopeptide repeat protein [Alloacidobacterium dinghuense]